MILGGAGKEEMGEYARKAQGMRTLKERGADLVEEGITTVEELKRVVYYDGQASW